MASTETPAQTINKFRSIVAMLADSTCKDDLKLKATQEISESFEQFLSSPVYHSFLDHLIKVFLKVLQEGEPHFIAEYNIQQVRKLILEMLYRLPTNETLRQYVKPILSLALKLLEIDNEENVLVCLKIIIELHKQFRPAFNSELQHFLQFVKNMYSELPNHINKIFEPKPPIKVKDLSDLNMDELLKETFTITMIQTEKRKQDQTVICYNLIPKAVLSLKVIQDLPIIVVLMYQLYKQSVYKDVSDFIPLIMTTITLQPSLVQRQSETFNKEIFVDFMGAQIKTLSFLAYIIKIYQDVVANHAAMLVQGMLGLLTLCPMEVAHLRRELLIASRHILATDLRNKFVPHMERLFDEDVLLGRGWTTQESLRPLAYSTLADLVHHVRQQLTLPNIARAVHLFSKNVHDDSLATTIQTMSCKLLLNLVDCIRHRAEVENATEGKELLMRMLEVFVLKFKTIAKIQLPRMAEKYSKQQTTTTPSAPQQQGIDIKSEVDLRTQQEMLEANLTGQTGPKDEKLKFGFPQAPTYNVTDYRSLVKTLVCGVKTITWGYATCKPYTTANSKQFAAHETLVFIRLVKWALKALDVYTLSCGNLPLGGQARMNQQNVRNKEEKEVLEHFSSVFTMMNAQTFHEIFSTTIEYIVERVYKNPTLQIVPNTLLANPSTSPIFATVLVEYLLERMDEMGSNLERSNLYLRLFKLVFGSVSLFPQENENMLRPHLHQIVNRSMELAMGAKEPYNYFLLLRALFRSIGGGSHDLLYQEFLPLLPNLLEGLNRLQSGLHKVHMKDLFVELCLTVPVRLSSLLPYLPMLMDPLVSALNGSNVLISQGLRTLELCVDNLQHDFLYDHIQPVRAELMQALWKTLRNNTQEQIAQVAFKVLGKFGGGNRKMLNEPQKLEYVSTDQDVPAILAYFKDQHRSIEFPVSRVIETAFNALKQSTTDSFYRKQAWETIHCYLAASLDLSDEKATLVNLFMHHGFGDPATIVAASGSAYKSVYRQARETHQTALIGMFVAAAIKELRYPALQTMYSIVRHYTMVAVAQQSGHFAITPTPNEQVPLDPMLLVDALFVIFGHEEKELCKPGEYALAIIVNIATNLLGSKDMACKLPFVEYLSERMCALCYERAWYAKLGGCKAIEVMLDRCAKNWVYEHMYTFLKALLFVMMDLTGEVSSGALDSAKNNLEKLLVACVSPLDENDSDVTTKNLQEKALNKVCHELVRQITSPHTLVREQSMSSLKLMAEKLGKTVTEIMEPFKDQLAEMVPPKKHLLKHQPANAQMGLMDGNMFCTSLNPRLFSIDMNVKEHKQFISDLISLCNTDDSKLQNYSCYKSLGSFVPLRVSALRALAACHYLDAEVREAIFQVLYRTLEGPNAELQRTAFECMKIFIGGYQMEKDVIHKTMRPLLMTLGDTKSLTLNGLMLLSYLTQLFPKAFNEKLCEQLLEILKELLENLVTSPKPVTGISKKGEEEKKIITCISIFHQTPAASSKFIRQLTQYLLQTERALYVEASSPFREELMKFLIQYPNETLQMFLDDSLIKDSQYSRYLHFLIKHPEGKVFRETLQNDMVHKLVTLSNANLNPSLTQSDKNEYQYQSIRIVSLLIKFDDQWLSSQQDLVDSFKRIWCTDAYQERHKKVDTLEFTHWKEPKLLVKILLHYFCHHPNDIDLLFELLRATTDRFIPDFQFLRDFLENTIAQNYTVVWKRSAFFRFVEHFTAEDMSQELIAKILQLIIIPCFAVGFERGETNKLIGTPPAPYHDHPDNVVSVFLNRVVDPDSPFPFADCVRISLLQFSCLLVEQASPHIHDHDATNKTQSFKLRRLMTFAWPCLLGKNCVDAATRYHGLLLLSHIIDKFAIHRKIVLQVFHSLLKAHGLEARSVVRQALEILTPSMPLRMEEGHKMLTHWTKKIIVDEGHSIQQLYHILQLVVKHYRVYYPVRHHLVQHMINSLQRMGFSPTASMEHKRLAVELAEVIIKWELNGVKEEDVPIVPSSPAVAVKKSDPDADQQRKKFAAGGSGATAAVQSTSKSSDQPDVSKPLDRLHIEMVLNSLMRLACQVNDPPAANPQTVLGMPPGEMLSRRCVSLLKTALKPELWSYPIEISFAFYDKLLQTLESASPNYANICTGLELLTFLLSVLKKEQILAGFKLLQRRLGACVQSTNSKVIKAMHTLLHKLMSIFPTERTNSNLSCKYEELEMLYSTVGKTIFEGLSNYEKNPQATPPSLFGPLMVLKAACMNNNSYIDLLITPFMRVLQKLQKEHLTPTAPESSLVTSELLILSLDLVKTRVVVMGVEMRKSFIGTILVGLIEKSPDVKVMKAINKMLEEWMKNKNVVTLSQAPSLREKSILLVKMMQYLEKRFPEDQELNGQFLELVNYVYTDETLKQSELTAKLEQAFLAGLRSPQPNIRAKFFKVFNESMRRKLHDRILYIICSQNWDSIGPHYWIKQCIELLLATVSPDRRIQMSHESCIVPSISSVVGQADADRKTEFLTFQRENPYVYEMLEVKEEILDIDLSNGDVSNASEEKVLNRSEKILKILNEHVKFIEQCRNVTPDQFFAATAQLCHMDTALAESVWLDLFPKLWDILDEQQRQVILQDIQGFMTSGTHIVQKDCHPSAIDTFVEGVSRCNPPIPIAAPIMKYLGKSHNLWHRTALALEQMAFDSSSRPAPYDLDDANSKSEVFTSLNEMYTLLCEEDMWAGMWQKFSHWKETNTAIAYEQHGFYEQAQSAYELCFNKYKQDCATGPVPTYTQKEVCLWENHWLRCAKELSQWEFLTEYSKHTHYNAYGLLESAWRIPNWEFMKEALTNVEYSYHKELAWKVTMYGGFLLICNPEPDKPLKFAEKYVETATTLCLNEWRRLPTIVSHIHVQYLQAAQQIMELQEAYQIHKGLLQGHQNSLHDMKAIVKTWRNRLPVIADDLSHWNDIFTWRQHHYQFIINHYDTLGDRAHTNSMLGVHASAQSIIHYGKIARKHKLTGVCLDSLNKIYMIASVHIVDCFQKIRQQVKCYLQMASVSNNRSELHEGLEVINNTNVRYFSKEMTAEFYAMKGLLYHLSSKSEDANKWFSVAIQMHDSSIKSWALYGDYLEQVFTRDPRQVSIGVNAIVCFLHACRVQNESKARKYLAKVLWLLSYDDDKGSLMEALDKYSAGVPPNSWVPWIPQLLNCLVLYDGNVIANLLCQVGRMFPQAVYFPIRTLYLTLRTAAARKIQMQSQEQNDANSTSTRDESATATSTTPGTTATGSESIKASPAMVRCSKIMKMLCDLHTTTLSSLEGIADQMEWFREKWHEEVLRQLRQGLAKCYAIAFENREGVNEAKITPHILNFVKKLVSTFGIGVEHVSSSTNMVFHSAASECLARRAEATYQDPVFKEMKVEFTRDFDFNALNSIKLHSLIFKLKKWIGILENHSKILLQSFLIEERCRYLATFTLKTGDVELPGEFLLPKHTHYYVKISRFMPRVDIVQKHNTAARRLYIRGHNGKIYPYLVVNDSGLADARREERVLQLLRMLNHYLGKQKETSKRFLNYTVPRVVSVSQHFRLIEDNPASISLLDIFKKGCSKLNIEHDAPIHHYYERLANVQSRGIKASHQVYREILKGVQANMVPRNLLKQWAVSTFPSATDYWQFRKMFTLQLALSCFAEYVLHLTRLNPDMTYLHQDSGLVNVAYFKFDVDDSTGELDTTRPVPFRLTPNVVEFLSPIGIGGPLTASMIATARCFAYPNFKVFSIMRPILRDEMVLSRIKKTEDPDVKEERLNDNEQLIGMVNKAVSSISNRLNSLAHFDGVDSKVATLVTAASSHDNLCRMDPAWHPWL